MEKRIKTDEIPHQAHLLYIKFYCENKGEKSKNTIQAAKKSWASLNPSKKKLFCETVNNSNILKHGHSLSKTLSYLRDKIPRNGRQDKETERDEIVLSSNNSSVKENECHNNSNDSHIDTEIVNDTQNATDLEERTNRDSSPESNQDCNSTPASPLNEPVSPTKKNATRLDDIVDRESNSDYQGYSSTPAPPLCAPIPPTVQNGKELYYLLKGHGAPDFSILDKREKNHYHKAVRRLKREYIKNYTIFLESLSKRDLFDHYMKTLH